MVSIKDKIDAELENITLVLKEIEKVKDRTYKELVVIVGMGAFLQDIYLGMENILKQLLKKINIQIPNTPTWHKDLLNLSIENEFISKETANRIGKYLFFRHFFTHAYGFQLDKAKLKPLINNIPKIFSDFKREIDNFLSKLDENIP